MLLLLAKFDSNSSFTQWRIPADIINYIVSFYTHFMDPMKHITINSVESEYDNVQWVKGILFCSFTILSNILEHTLDFNPENTQKGWFSSASTTKTWIVYDFGFFLFFFILVLFFLIN